MAAEKQTPVASTVARMETERLAQEKRADEKAAKEEIPTDRVLVRLTRPCFDSNGVLHGVEEPALLAAGDVPTSAKVLAIGSDVQKEDFSLGFIMARKNEEALAAAREEARARALARTGLKVEKPDDDDVVDDDADEQNAADPAAKKDELAKKAAAEAAAKKS